MFKLYCERNPLHFGSLKFKDIYIKFCNINKGRQPIQDQSSVLDADIE